MNHLGLWMTLLLGILFLIACMSFAAGNTFDLTAAPAAAKPGQCYRPRARRALSHRHHAE